LGSAAGAAIGAASVERAVRSFLDFWRELTLRCRGGRYDDADGIVSYQTGLPVPPFNGVFVVTANARVDAVLAAVDDMAARGLPWNVQLRPGYPAELDDALTERGLAVTEQVPFMIAPAGAALPDNGDVDLRDVVTYADVEVVLSLLEQGFGIPPAITRGGFPMAAFFLSGVRTWIARASDVDVSTALGVTRDGVCGIYNVATPEAERRRGYGGLATAAAMRAGFAAGAELAFLQSSPMGYPVYERLGFHTVERWTQWMPKVYLQG
jgi:hypothetical protein